MGDEAFEKMVQSGLFLGAQPVKEIGVVILIIVELVGRGDADFYEFDDIAAWIVGGQLAGDKAVFREFGYELSAGTKKIGRFFLALISAQ